MATIKHKKICRKAQKAQNLFRDEAFCGLNSFVVLVPSCGEST